MADPELVAKLDEVSPREFSGEVCRHAGPGIHPLNTTGAQTQGGRWNPPNSFPALYLALTHETAAAEFYRRAEGENLAPEDLLPRRLHQYRVQLSAVLDLTNVDVRNALGISEDDITSDDRSFCNSLGDAAHYVGFEGILAPSATGAGDVLVVFWDRLKAESDVEPVSHTDWTSPP
jgi:RES domain-containing protein